MEFHKILKNVDILIYIYKVLNIEDQFRLAQVNSELRNLFERYIFPQKNYSTLKIVGNGENVVVTNESNRNRIVLKPAEFQEFIHYHGKDVKILEQLRGTVLDDLRPMQNLTAIRYCFTTIHIKYFEELEKMCPQLELIHVNICIDKNGKQIMLGNNLDVKSLLPLKKLKSLSINHDYGPDVTCTITYGEFIELVTELKLEYLSLEEWIMYYDISKSTRDVLVNPVHLKELNIGFHGYTGNISPYVPIFKNLVTLVISIHDATISDLLLRNLADACINLNVLHIRFSEFENIQSFSIPSKVKELSLSECDGLTTQNLRQILTSPGLTKFYSQLSYYEEEEDFKDFTISPSLQILHINDYMNSFKLAFGGSKSLKYLSWEVDYFPAASRYTDVGLQNSTNLEELALRWQNLSPTTLSQLNLLQKLTITMSEHPDSLSYIRAILQHSPLTEVILEHKGKTESPRNTTDLPGFPTNVRILRIDQEIFDMALHFWLDLVAHNEELHLEINKFKEKRTEFMRTLIAHEKFPNNRKTLDICGFTFKCSDLKRSFDATMEKLMKGNTEDLNRVIFLRNENTYI